MAIDHGPIAPLVVCGDFGDSKCGVGASEAALVAASGIPCPVLDPLAGLRDVRRAVAEARRDGRPAVIAFPTDSTVKSLRALRTFALTTLALRRHGVRWHLHEYRIYREIRWALNVLIALGAGSIVVSRHSEADALQRQWGGRLCRRRRVDVIPPANGTAREPSASLRQPTEGLVGVFGVFRPEDRDVAWLSRVLVSLPPAFRHLELIGSGWENAVWPDEVNDRYSVTVAGRVADDELDARIEAWSLSLASFAGGASDGKMSLRTPLANGVPTITEVQEPADLTIDVPHLIRAGSDGTVAASVLEATLAVDRAAAAAAVERFEHACRQRLTAALLS